MMKSFSRYHPHQLMGFKSGINQRKSVLRLAPVSAAVQLVPYTPIQKKENYDLRLLEPHTCVVTEYQRRDAGFLSVGSFLSGHNSTGVLFQETQPVVMTFRPNGGPKTMQIYLVPREDSGAGDDPLPTPLDDGVELEIAGGELIATMQFEGNATKEACEKTRNRLLECLQQDGMALADAEAEGLFRLAQYGPIHSLSTRTNEIWLAVKL